MPFTQAQIQRIISHNGKPVIVQGTQRNLAILVTESYIRRRLFAHEDDAVVRLFKSYTATFDELRGEAERIADGLHMDAFTDDGHNIAFKRAFMQQAAPRLRRLAQVASSQAFEASVTAYLAGYYGRLWLLDSATRPDVRIKTPAPRLLDVQNEVVRFGLREQVDEDVVRGLLGQEWMARYELELDDLIQRMTRTLNRSIADGIGMRQAMRRLAAEMGVDIDRRKAVPDARANFNRVQAITRTSIQDVSNRGALASYRANRDVVNAVEFLETFDNRTCPICDRRQGGLGGTVWSVDSPQIVRPPAHPNCRCTLIPVVDLAAIVADEFAPPFTFREWIDTLGPALTLTSGFEAFITGRKVTTPRIGDDFEVEDFS